MKRGALVAVAVIALLAAAGVAVVSTGDESTEPQVATPVVARNRSALASIVLPPGWHELPIMPTDEPIEVLVVGTAARPDAEPITPCDFAHPLPESSAFVSIYEYSTGARLNAPDHQSVYDATQFMSRPPDFATAPRADLSNCGISSSPLENDGSPSTSVSSAADPVPTVLDFTFLDSGRFFVARVVAAADPEGTRLADAIEVLSGLEIALPPDVTTTTTNGPTPTTVVPIDVQEAAREQITDDLRGAFGGGGPVTHDEAIIGGFPLGEGAREAAKVGRESFIGVIVPRVDWLTVDTPTHATINFDLFIDGQMITANTTSEAIFIEGRWKLTAEAFCTIARRGNVTCPAH